MTAAILEAAGLVKRFGGLVATRDVSLAVAPGELHALIGPNGAGKSTLIAQLMGDLRPDAGTIRLAGEDVTRLPTQQRIGRGLARTFQVAQLVPGYTAAENVALAVRARRGHAFAFWRRARSDEAVFDAASRHLAHVELGGRAEIPAAGLAQGERKQLELAIALACEPRLLLLDEPMAGLGPGESRAMVEILRSLKGKVAMLLVEHDMDAVFALADRISVLEAGRLLASGTPASIQDDPAVRAAYLGEGDA